MDFCQRCHSMTRKLGTTRNKLYRVCDSCNWSEESSDNKTFSRTNAEFMRSIAAKKSQPQDTSTAVAADTRGANRSGDEDENSHLDFMYCIKNIEDDAALPRIAAECPRCKKDSIVLLFDSSRYSGIAGTAFNFVIYCTLKECRRFSALY